MDNQPPQNPNGIAGKPEPQIQGDSSVYDSYQAANELPEKLAKPDIQEDIAALHDDKLVKPLRTYESDVAELLKKKDASVVKIAVAEQKKIERTKPPAIERPARKFSISPNVLIIVASGLLVGVGLATLVYVGFEKITAKKPAPYVATEPPIISTDSTEKIIVPAHETVTRALSVQAPQLTGAAGSLIELKFLDGAGTTTELSTESFAVRLPSSMPTLLVTSLNHRYVMGYKLLDNPEPFLIFKTDSYENGFAGMLKWEASLQTDIDKLRMTGSSSPALSDTTGQVFHDVIVSNKDVRVLKDATGKPVVMYSLPDKQTIVVTTNEKTLKEIFNRLSTSRFVQ